MASRTFKPSARIFYSPKELGLSTSPKPTLFAVSSAMPNGSIGIFNTTEIDESEMTLNLNLVSAILLLKISEVRQFAFGARTYASVVLGQARLFYGAYNSVNQTWVGWKEITLTTE